MQGGGTLGIAFTAPEGGTNVDFPLITNSSLRLEWGEGLGAAGRVLGSFDLVGSDLGGPTFGLDISNLVFHTNGSRRTHEFFEWLPGATVGLQSDTYEPVVGSVSLSGGASVGGLSGPMGGAWIRLGGSLDWSPHLSVFGDAVVVAKAESAGFLGYLDVFVRLFQIEEVPFGLHLAVEHLAHGTHAPGDPFLDTLLEPTAPVETRLIIGFGIAQPGEE